MRWTPEAEAAVKEVPFFVRTKVRARVEAEALHNGKKEITLAEVKTTQKRYLTGMQPEVKGYQVDVCFGPSGCLNAIGPAQGLVEQIENLLQYSDFLDFFASIGIRNLKFHHEFRVTVADCPNACSQPQIKDIGIISARRPMVSAMPCTACEACVDSCREAAIDLDKSGPIPVIDLQRCVACGQCIPVCPSGTLVVAAEGYRIQLGGKLGRHPQLAFELPGIHTPAAILEMVDTVIDIYKKRNQKGERFGDIMQPEDIMQLTERFGFKAR